MTEAELQSLAYYASQANVDWSLSQSTAQRLAGGRYPNNQQICAARADLAWTFAEEMLRNQKDRESKIDPEGGAPSPTA